MRQTRYRALITLDDASAKTVREYQCRTHALMIHACRLDTPSYGGYFPCEMTWEDEEQPLRNGDHAIVTITVTDDQAAEFLAAGQHFTMWNGREVGHGVISRRVYFSSSPC